jgi:hypothetical protein
MQFHRFPRLRDYDMILWMDMTKSFNSARVLADFWEIFERNPNRAIILYDHWRHRHCQVSAEVQGFLITH